ncbi:MAG: GtrA family protein [Actinomycetota bacterium]|nr:GtrA family protein [Actinomycetota bacterium]
MPSRRTPANAAVALGRSRAALALQRRHNWIQLAKFCAVGASGYLVNLAVFALLLRAAAFHYLSAAACSFLVAVSNNYLWNRVWTFRRHRGHLAAQGVRFLVVSVAALGLNLLFLDALVAIGVAEIPAQAVAVVLVTPVNFAANKLWSFSPKRAARSPAT